MGTNEEVITYLLVFGHGVNVIGYGGELSYPRKFLEAIRLCTNYNFTKLYYLQLMVLLRESSRDALKPPMSSKHF